MSDTRLNPAIVAAIEAQQQINESLDSLSCFRLEAGAGAGKTYSLVEALRRIIDNRGIKLLQTGKKIACITYTEVARDEINKDIDRHPAILVQTIHGFCWAFLAQFQKAMRGAMLEIDRHKDKISEAGGIEGKSIEYKSGFFRIDEQTVSLSHDDIPCLMAKLMGFKKFRNLLAQQFPVIFIDEYQDTNEHFMRALSDHFFGMDGGPLVGLFGDHWQMIYRDDFELANFSIKGIDKKANFRSVPAIVDVLNNLRSELPQAPCDPDAVGEARFFYVESYKGERIKGGHFKNDLPPDVAREVVAALVGRLRTEGWDTSPEKTKILMLTHNMLAAEQGYKGIANVYDRKESFIKKEDPVIAFLVDVIEPMCQAYEGKRYGDMFAILGGSPVVLTHADKMSWQNSMRTLNTLRQQKTVGDVIAHLAQCKKPQMPDAVSDLEGQLNVTLDAEGPDGLLSSRLERYAKLKNVPYKEIIELTKFVNNFTPFATQHSVKGAEFENVLVVLGGGWNQYNWPKLFETMALGGSVEKSKPGFLRARNLFYVSISRPMRRLAVLATQTLSSDAIRAVHQIFSSQNFISI